jgi:hypothetical protein
VPLDVGAATCLCSLPQGPLWRAPAAHVTIEPTRLLRDCNRRGLDFAGQTSTWVGTAVGRLMTHMLLGHTVRSCNSIVRSIKHSPTFFGNGRPLLFDDENLALAAELYQGLLQSKWCPQLLIPRQHLNVVRQAVICHTCRVPYEADVVDDEWIYSVRIVPQLSGPRFRWTLAEWWQLSWCVDELVLKQTISEMLHGDEHAFMAFYAVLLCIPPTQSWPMCIEC